MSELEGLRGRLCLHFDGVAGAAGDMVLGALLAMGVPRSVITGALTAVGLGNERIRVREIVKGGIAATDVTVRTDDAGDHDHTHYSEIRDRIGAASLDDRTRELALEIFGRLGRAESKMHDRPLEEVHFHEVGAIDSIADIVGAAAGLAWLAPTTVSSATVIVGEGGVGAAHGRLPVPSPAALEIFREAGGQIRGGGVARELCTPTGAAILCSVVERWGGLPAATPVAIGYGAGDIELDDRPNVLRLVACESPGLAPWRTDQLLRLEANVDDMNPELCQGAEAALRAAGAIDVWWSPVAMKKGRPALLLTALVPENLRAAAAEAVVRETTTLGVRFDLVDRLMLEREIVSVETEFGPVDVKIGRLGERELSVSPEYEACRRVAEGRGVAAKVVYAAALAAYRRPESD